MACYGLRITDLSRGCDKNSSMRCPFRCVAGASKGAAAAPSNFFSFLFFLFFSPSPQENGTDNATGGQGQPQRLTRWQKCDRSDLGDGEISFARLLRGGGAAFGSVAWAHGPLEKPLAQNRLQFKQIQCQDSVPGPRCVRISVSVSISASSLSISRGFAIR